MQKMEEKKNLNIFMQGTLTMYKVSVQTYNVCV